MAFRERQKQKVQYISQCVVGKMEGHAGEKAGISEDLHPPTPSLNLPIPINTNSQERARRENEKGDEIWLEERHCGGAQEARARFSVPSSVVTNGAPLSPSTASASIAQQTHQLGDPQLASFANRMIHPSLVNRINGRRQSMLLG